jgi:RNA polymerase sigma-70 factor, ECF subfamily
LSGNKGKKDGRARQDFVMTFCASHDTKAGLELHSLSRVLDFFVELPRIKWCGQSIRRLRVTFFQLQSDEELMEELRQGHSSALSVLFDRHYRLVFSVALRILRDHGEAEDLMQEVFLEIFQKIDQFDPAKGSAKTWILQYAYHRSLNRQRYLNLRSFYDGKAASELDEWELPRTSSAWNGLTYHDWSRVIQKGLETLTQKERQTLDLVYFQGFVLKDVSAQLNEPLPNVRNHYYRGLRKLRDFLQERSYLKKKPA